MIGLENLSKEYDEVVAVRNLTLAANVLRTA